MTVRVSHITKVPLLSRTMGPRAIFVCFKICCSFPFIRISFSICVPHSLHSVTRFKTPLRKCEAILLRELPATWFCWYAVHSFCIIRKNLELKEICIWLQILIGMYSKLIFLGHMIALYGCLYQHIVCIKCCCVVHMCNHKSILPYISIYFPHLSLQTVNLCLLLLGDLLCKSV